MSVIEQKKQVVKSKRSVELAEALNSPPEPAKIVRRYPTGCRLLDIMIGGGLGIGIPGGSIINLIGDKSSGKTFFKNEIIAASYHADNSLKWFSDDTESGDTFDTSALYGFNIRPEQREIGGKEVIDSETVEELDAKMSAFIKDVPENTPAIYAVDSLDGLQSAEHIAMAANRTKQFEAGKVVEDDGSYQTALQKFLSQHLFRGHHKKFMQKEAVMVVVSQIRDNISNEYGHKEKYKVSGGKALEFYCHTRLFLKNVHKIMKRDAVVGLVVEAKLIKSKTPRPFRKCRFTLYFDYGIDDIGSSVDYLYDLRDEKGSLVLSKCQQIRFGGANSPPRTKADLIEWLQERTGESHKGTMEELMQIIEQDEKLKNDYTIAFGSIFNRGSLIEHIEKSKSAKAWLDQMVLDKWEEGEKEIASNRGCKYGNY